MPSKPTKDAHFQRFSHARGRKTPKIQASIGKTKTPHIIIQNCAPRRTRNSAERGLVFGYIVDNRGFAFESEAGEEGMSGKIKSDTDVEDESVNFDGSTSPDVLGRRLAERLLEDTDAFVFRKGKRVSGGLSPWSLLPIGELRSGRVVSFQSGRRLDTIIRPASSIGSKRLSSVVRNRLVDMDIPIMMIKIALTTPYLKTSEKPLSVLFVADPGSGKSAMISMFASAKGAAYFGGGVTAWGLYNELSDHLKRKGSVSHVLIDDLIPSLSRGKKIRDNFIASLLKLTEEGSTGNYSYEYKDLPKFDPPLKVGMISGVTREYLFKKNKWGTGTEGIRKDFLSTGWLERNIPFTYSYGEDTLREIYERMKANSMIDSPVVKLNLPVKKFVVEVPEPYATEVQDAGRKVGESIESNGLRYARDFLEIARAIALIRVLDRGLDRTKISVTEEDMKLFRSLTKYINLDFVQLAHQETKERGNLLPSVRMETCVHPRTRPITIDESSPEWDVSVHRGGRICLDCGASLEATIDQAKESMIRRQMDHYHNTRERAGSNAERAMMIMDQTKLNYCAMLPQTGTPYPVPETCQVEGCETRFSPGYSPAAPMTKIRDTIPYPLIFRGGSGLPPRVSLVCRHHYDLMQANKFTGNMKGAYPLDDYDNQWYKEHPEN